VWGVGGGGGGESAKKNMRVISTFLNGIV